jgi:hypothetical protein
MVKGYKAPKKGGQVGMMQQLQKLQEQLQMAQEQLAEEIVAGSAGGGVVKVMITGDQHCTAVEIDPELVKDGDVEMLQDLILTAMNNALDETRRKAAERLGPLTGGLSL